MGFGGKIDDKIRFFCLQEFIHQFAIADITVSEEIVGISAELFQIFGVAGVGYDIQIDNPVVAEIVKEKANKIAADKAQAAGDEYSFHIGYLSLFF
jgi:hypothetical protein